jgi:hypothetical protein
VAVQLEGGQFAHIPDVIPAPDLPGGLWLLPGPEGGRNWRQVLLVATNARPLHRTALCRCVRAQHAAVFELQGTLQSRDADAGQIKGSQSLEALLLLPALILGDFEKSSGSWPQLGVHLQHIGWQIPKLP